MAIDGRGSGGGRRGVTDRWHRTSSAHARALLLLLPRAAGMEVYANSRYFTSATRNPEISDRVAPPVVSRRAAVSIAFGCCFRGIVCIKLVAFIASVFLRVGSFVLLNFWENVRKDRMILQCRPVAGGFFLLQDEYVWCRHCFFRDFNLGTKNKEEVSYIYITKSV